MADSTENNDNKPLADALQPQQESTDSSKPFSFQPYKNDHQSLQIGELIFENQTDKVIVYGDIDICKDQQGLSQALKLQKMFNLIVEELQTAKSSGEFEADNSALENGNEKAEVSKEIDNPFS